MRTAIATDSNSGITQEQAAKLGIYVLPMPFMINGEMFYEGGSPITESESEISVASVINLVHYVWDSIFVLRHVILRWK